jgi:hypothetical protein
MGRFTTAMRAFFRVLGNAAFAEQVQRLLEGQALNEGAALGAMRQVAAPVAPAVAAAPRTDALNLVAVLQREARLVDFIKESLQPYSDAQIGAAVRDIHRDCGGVLERVFALRPVMEQAEGAEVQVPAGFDANRIRLTGNVTGQPPFMGALRHGGWQATRVELPEWSGSAESARIVAAAEVELR